MNDARDVCESDAETDAGAMRGITPSFGGLSPRDAAQLRWSRAREREAAAEESYAEPSDTEVRAEIIAALKRKARQGDEAAARELRNWLPPLPPDPSVLSELEQLELAKRELLSSILLVAAEVGWDAIAQGARIAATIALLRADLRGASESQPPRSIAPSATYSESG
jgi:hypothetical protein